MTVSVVEIERQHMDEVIELLQSLSVYKPNEEEYEIIWNNFKAQSNVYSLVAIKRSVVVGYGSVHLGKNIRDGKIGFIEDIVTHYEYREQGIGKLILDSLHEIAFKKACYKVTLQCKEHNSLFYEKCGYRKSGLAMQNFI